MNERIRELAEHCDFYVGNEHSTESYEEQQRIWAEKFAELIVRECVAVADRSVVSGQSMIGQRIQQHFGVEE